VLGAKPPAPVRDRCWPARIVVGPAIPIPHLSRRRRRRMACSQGSHITPMSACFAGGPEQVDIAARGSVRSARSLPRSFYRRPARPAQLTDDEGLQSLDAPDSKAGEASERNGLLKSQVGKPTARRTSPQMLLITYGTNTATRKASCHKPPHRCWTCGHAAAQFDRAHATAAEVRPTCASVDWARTSIFSYAQSARLRRLAWYEPAPETTARDDRLKEIGPT